MGKGDTSGRRIDEYFKTKFYKTTSGRSWLVFHLILEHTVVVPFWLMGKNFLPAVNSIAQCAAYSETRLHCNGKKVHMMQDQGQL